MATIDWTHVTLLRDEMGDDFDDLLQVFLNEVDEGLSRLEEAPVGPDLADALHFLKGSALNLGLSSFASLCSDNEQLARCGGDVARGYIHDELMRSRQLLLSSLGAGNA